MSNIHIKQITINDSAYEDLLQLRNRVLRQPLGMNLFDEDLSRDKEDKIITAYENDKMIGCVMLKSLGDKLVKLRAMAVDKSFRGKGIGKMLVENAEMIAREDSYETIVLNARAVAKSFYSKMGYDTISDEFIEVTIPHVAMQKHIG